MHMLVVEQVLVTEAARARHESVDAPAIPLIVETAKSSTGVALDEDHVVVGGSIEQTEVYSFGLHFLPCRRASACGRQRTHVSDRNH